MKPTSLCQLGVDWDGSFPAGGMMAEEKHDGIRALRFAGVDGRVRVFSRNGIPIEGTGHILARLALMEEIAGTPLFVDGEFVVDGSLTATKAWFERGWRSGGEAGVFHAFDVLPFNDWRWGRCDMPLYQRKAWLQDLAAAADVRAGNAWDWRAGSRGRDDGRPAVIVTPDQWALTPADALDMARRVWARNGEGCMLKDAEAPYVRGRCRTWQKVKADSGWSRDAIPAPIQTVSNYSRP